LPALQRLGVRMAGRLVAVDGDRFSFANDLPLTTAAAEGRLEGLFRQIEEHIATNGLGAELLPAAPVRPFDLAEPVGELDGRAEELAAIVWATGYRREYPWLQVPVLDRDGEIAQRRGVTPVEGLLRVRQRLRYRRDA